MNFPGPSGVVLVFGLLGLAVAGTILGEAVRLLAVRWVVAWRELEALERWLLDFFLGGAVLYLLAALPVGGFSLGSLVAILVAGTAGVAWVAVGRIRSRTLSLRALVGPLVRPGALLAELAALALLLFEVAVALPVGTGNTFDSSLLTFYTARLVDGHQLAWSFLPSARVGILYPQGTTAWLGTAQLLMGLPGARTSLLLTPLFLGLAPIGGFVLGRRLFGGDPGGLALALVLAAVASWTRVLVAGSNDFVFAFPLVLWLAAQATVWIRSVPTPADAVGFGLVLGYSAALNPTGAQWLAPALLVMGVVAVPRLAGSAPRWLRRWGTAVAAALIPLIPTWYVLARGIASPGYVPGAGSAPSSPSGIDSARFVGFVDPYLFGPHDVWLSPLAALRAEIALLFTVGLAVLFLAGRAAFGPRIEPIRRFLIGGVVATVGLLGVDWAGSWGGPIGAVAEVVSESEVSIWLFAIYALIATIPLALALEWVARAKRAAPPEPPPAARRRTWHLDDRRGEVSAVLPLVIALVIVVPGALLTPTQLAPVLTTLYTDFGNVTAADFDLLSFAGTHLPSGARVLVAPGGAGEFLPAYDPTAVLLYPMLPGWTRVNASYALLVSELTNGTLDGAGLVALWNLGVQFIVVTPANSILWPAFSPAPLVDHGFAALFEQGGDYLFTTPPPPPAGGPPPPPPVGVPPPP
ncbi:MAG: hypothetical protein L3K02_04900 [Thermoplasmata archaeon]|nr:hypothetical protein [Thermoplasmata archaeon]